MNDLEDFQQLIYRYFLGEDRIIGLTLSFFVFTFLLSLVNPRYSDSAIHIIRSDFILQNLHFPYDEFAFNSPDAYVYPPLFHVMLAISNRLTGLYGLVPSSMGALSVFLTYKLVELWYDESTAYLSALGLAIFPLFLAWSSKIMVGTTVTAGFLLVFYSYFLYRDSGKRKYLYASFMIGGILMALKTYGSLSAVIVAAHIFWQNKESINELFDSFRNVLFPGIAGLVLAAPWPLRNLVKTGSPLPKLTGNPFSYRMPESIENTGIMLQGWEIERFLSSMMGVRTPILEALRDLNPILYFMWFLLPLFVLTLLAYGAWDERDNIFVWIWFSSVVAMYAVARVLSSGGFALKFRHFITVSPMLALFMTRAYQRLKLDANLKKLFFAALALGLVAQTTVSIVQTSYAVDTSHEPLGRWVDQNIPEDDVIYTMQDRPVAQYTDTDFKIITRSYKPGYINPDKNFSQEIKDKADWVITPDPPVYESDRERIEKAHSEGVLELEKTLDAKKDFLWGSVGKQWGIYKVNKD